MKASTKSAEVRPERRWDAVSLGQRALTALTPLHRCSLHAHVGWFGHFHRLCQETLFSRSGPSRFEDQRGGYPCPHVSLLLRGLCLSLWSPLFCITGRNWEGTGMAPEPQTKGHSCSADVPTLLCSFFQGLLPLKT